MRSPRPLLRRVARLLTGGGAEAPTATLGRLDDDGWFDTPIAPELILEGAPRARSVRLAVSADQAFVTFLWECSRGAFRKVQRSDESLQILEGSVTIRERDGRSYTLRPGDVAQLPLGLEAEWTIADRVRKLSVYRSDPTLPELLRARLRRFAR